MSQSLENLAVLADDLTADPDFAAILADMDGAVHRLQVAKPDEEIIIRKAAAKRSKSFVLGDSLRIDGSIDNAVLVLHWTGADGQSSKPSDGLKANFPNYGYRDIVDLQHKLVTETLGRYRADCAGHSLAGLALMATCSGAITLTVGLVITAGMGILLVGALNPISIAFAILFVGLGADFAVQFNLRYRAQRHASHELRQALLEVADRVGVPLTLAAAAAAAGFLSFTPTAYTGLAQLGKIAGCGMIVAYLGSFTLLPALLEAVNPPDEPRVLGQPALAPADNFLKRHRVLVIALTSILALAGPPSLIRLRDLHSCARRRKNRTNLRLPDSPDLTS